MTCRPSTLYHLADPLVALCFDRGVNLFGTLLEEAVRVAAKGAKNEKAAEAAARRTLDRWLASADPVDAPRAAGRFRDPFAEGLVAHA